MIRDIKWLSDAGKRLEMAREGIERAHGKDSFPTLVYIFSFKILNIFGMRFKVDQFSILILASYIDI